MLRKEAWYAAIRIVALMLILSGCMTGKKMSEIMNSWEGHHVSDLIRSWGPPHEVTSDGRGGKIYIWRYQGSIELLPGKTTERGSANVIGSSVYYRNQTTYRRPVTVEIDKQRMFWVNREGIIYHWQWKGL